MGGEFNCATCEAKPSLKEQNGCTAPPTIGGGKWRFPEMQPRAEIDRCPLKFVTADIGALFASVSLADGRMSVSEQLALPAPYVAAFSLAVRERDERALAESKRGAKDG